MQALFAEQYVHPAELAHAEQSEWIEHCVVQVSREEIVLSDRQLLSAVSDRMHCPVALHQEHLTGESEK
jgi:hypothetical protein